MQTRFFKFPDMETSFQLAQVAGLTQTSEIEGTQEEFLVRFTDQYAIDVVGEIYEPTGNILTDSEGFQFPEMQKVPGWHVNVRVCNPEDTIPETFLEYEIFPTTPTRDFA